MSYLIALGNGINPMRTLNGREINCKFFFCPIYKSSYVQRII